MKAAQSVATKFVQRASNASGDYVDGAKNTGKDQAANAIAGKDNYQKSLTASFARGSYEKGLQKSGKTGWLDGVTKKGANRFADGVSVSASKYATNSGAYDGARNAASSMPRGLKGSQTNLDRVKAVVGALRTAKVGSAA